VTSTARELLATTTLDLRKGPYTLAAWHIDRRGAVLAALAELQPTHAYFVADEREVTLFALESNLGGFPPPMSRENDWCLLTLDSAMEWDVVGVLAAVSAALAEAGIPLGAVAAFSRDHLLVQRGRLEQAIDCLSGLCKGIREA
jgi:hypothetical protein